MTAAPVTYGPMRAHPTGRRADCSFCKEPTNAEIEERGPRGASRWVPCCWSCGEQPLVRRQLTAGRAA